MSMVLVGVIVIKKFFPLFPLKLLLIIKISLLLFTLIILIAKGFNIVQQQERMVVELFGKYWRIKKPGLRWNFPGIVKVRAIVPTWELALPLFEEPISIDFKDGSVIPKGARAFLRVKSPDETYSLDGETKPRTGIFRAVYSIDNWRDRSAELFENAVRSFLATLTIDQALPEGRGGFDLLTANRMPEEEKNRIKTTLDQWGLELFRITITDFDLDKEVISAREEVQKRKRAVEVAMFEKDIRAFETVGALIQMLVVATGKSTDEIEKEISNDPKLKKMILEFCKELITRQMSIDGKALTDVRVGGTKDGVLSSLLSAIAAYKKIGEKNQGLKKASKGDKKAEKDDSDE